MAEVVQLWVYLSASPLFGLTATLVVYVLAYSVYQRLHQAPWANPVLWSVLVIASGLLATDVDYPTYFAGAQFIHFLLGPAVVALAWPLWLRRAELQRRWGRLLLAALAGLPQDVLLSLVPKSVTAPVAMGIADKIGGIAALAAVFAVLTGIVGALLGKYLFDALRIPTNAEGWAARGFALGTVSHGIGAARAIAVNADAGAYAGLALALQVLLASVLVPLAAKLLVLVG
jgi:putative effector of murein hydrolase